MMRSASRSPISGHPHDRGAVIPIVALLLPVIILMTAFAVDLGRQRSDRRDMQAAADVIALDMSRLANGRTLTQIQAGYGGHPAAITALTDSADRNGIDVNDLTLDWGIWDDANGYQSINLVGAAIPNAAQIVSRTTTDYFFRPGSGDVVREAVAVNGMDPQAGFSVGSFGAAMSTDESELLNDIISPLINDDPNDPLLPDPVLLDAASYEGLAGADIPLGDLLPDPRFNAGTPRELLDAEVPMDEFMLASANVLRNQGNVAEAELVEQSITAKMGSLTVKLANYVSAESGAEDAAMGASVDLPTIIQGAVYQAQCTQNPQGFDECSAINIPSLSASLPLLAVNSSVTVIESPRYAYGRVGKYADTGQFQLTLKPQLGAQAVGTCTPSVLPPIQTCLIGSLLAQTVDATVDIEATLSLASGRTTIQDIDCADPAALKLALQSATSLYEVDVKATVTFGTRGTLGGLLGTAFGTLTLVGSTDSTPNTESVGFTVAPDVLGQTVRSTGAGTFGLAPISLTSTGSTTVLNDLSSIDINYTIGDVANNLVNPLLTEIDNNVLTPFTDLMGLNVTGADLVAQAIDCEPGLVELVQ